MLLDEGSSEAAPTSSPLSLPQYCRRSHRRKEKNTWKNTSTETWGRCGSCSRHLAGRHGVSLPSLRCALLVCSKVYQVLLSQVVSFISFPGPSVSQNRVLKSRRGEEEHDDRPMALSVGAFLWNTPSNSGASCARPTAIHHAAKPRK